MTDDENSTTEMRDIDAVIQAVRQKMPGIQVTQWQKIWHNDDDNLWWFALSGVKPNIQIENSACPFLLETNEQDCKNALKAGTVQEAVTMIVDYLTVTKEGRSCRLNGQLYWPE